MENTFEENTIDFTEQEWTFLLFLLFMEDQKQRSETWDQFENDLVYKNRFSSNSPIVEELRKRAEQATRIISSGSIFYRARSFKNSSFDKLIRYYMKERGCSEKEIKDVLNNWTDSDKLISLLPEIYSDADPDYLEDNNESAALIRAQQKWKKNVRFKGYSAAESAAPPPDLIDNGRANPDHIRYLYLCEDDITPVYEIRPIIGEQVSVAKFTLQKEVKVYDLTLDIQDQMKNPDYLWPSLYNTIGKMFSKPYNGELKHYLPTQFLAEEIKKMGFDGLRFNSSLHKGGINIVFFNPVLCKATSSQLRTINGINIDIGDPLIYTIGKKSQKGHQPSATEKNISKNQSKNLKLK